MRFLGPVRERAAEAAVAKNLSSRLEHDGYGWWVLEIKGGDSFAGVIALQDVPFEAHFTPALEVGWRLRSEHWGQGYATEGAAAALKFAFDSLDRREVVAMTAAINRRSQGVMRRIGMTRDSADDFNNPRLADGDPLRPHVLYRIARTM